MADQHDHSHGGRSDRLLQCSIVTPEATVLEVNAPFVALPLYDGEVGIQPAHSPFIGRLGYGEMRVVNRRRDLALLYRRWIRSSCR